MMIERWKAVAGVQFGGIQSKSERDKSLILLLSRSDHFRLQARFESTISFVIQFG